MTSVTVEHPEPAFAAVTHTGEGTAPLSRGVWLIAGAVFVALVASAGRYGWHRDELYFREAGRHLAWGYVDQPPFTPLVARLADLVAPGNLVALRLAPALATVATIVLAALIVGELGGDRRAQLVGAGTAASAGFVLGAGHVLSTATFDLTAWMAVLWLVARLLRTADSRWWVAIGAVAGVAMLNKNLVVMLLAAVVVALAVERRRDLLVTRWLPVGGALALAIAAPHLVWQATDGWPQFEMARALSDRLGGENRAMLLPQQVLLLGPLLVRLWWGGIRLLGRDPAGRRFRPLLWAWPLCLAAVFVTGGRPYYPVALGLAVALAGAPAAARRGRGIVALLAVNAAVCVVFTLPVLPMSTARVTASLNDTIGETIGWPELTAEVASVVHGLPPAERAHVVILAASYGEAGAIDRFGPALGLPPAYSGHNSYYDFRRPTDDRATVVAVRYRPEDLASEFARCTRVATVDNHHDVANEAQGVPILVCRGLRAPWAETWPRLRHVS
jgi:hypothetical protein